MSVNPTPADHWIGQDPSLRDGSALTTLPALAGGRESLGIEHMFDYSRSMTTYAPPGWPAGVRPPGVPGWEQSAASWLLDHCPPEYRGYPVLRRHEVVLAGFAVRHLEASHEAVVAGLREARTSLLGHVSSDVVESVVTTWLKEEARLQRDLRCRPSAERSAARSALRRPSLDALAGSAGAWRTVLAWRASLSASLSMTEGGSCSRSVTPVRHARPIAGGWWAAMSRRVRASRRPSTARWRRKPAWC